MSTESIHNHPDTYSEPEFSIIQWMNQYIHKVKIALQYWKLILICMIIGSVLGLAYALLKSKTYTAKLSFIVEDAKTSGGSMASALAGELGFDLGNLSGGNGILSGDNVLELLKSSRFMKSTLLSDYADSSANGITLADQYATVYQLSNKWKNSDAIGKEIHFNILKDKPSRLEDSLLQIIILRISEKELNISKPDKKLNIFEIETTMRDEKLAQLFCERLLKKTTDFYIETKTNRSKKNVDRLQKRADSIGLLLNRQTYASSSENTKLIDLNPVYGTNSVPAEITARDKVVLSTIYAEVIKSLEVSKSALMQETPTVQIIDHPELPLKVNSSNKGMTMIEGALLAFVISLLWLVFFKKEALSKHDH